MVTLGACNFSSAGILPRAADFLDTWAQFQFRRGQVAEGQWPLAVEMRSPSRAVFALAAELVEVLRQPTGQDFIRRIVIGLWHAAAQAETVHWQLTQGDHGQADDHGEYRLARIAQLLLLVIMSNAGAGMIEVFAGDLPVSPDAYAGSGASRGTPVWRAYASSVAAGKLPSRLHASSIRYLYMRQALPFAQMKACTQRPLPWC